MSEKRLSVGIVTLGCKVNQYESEAIAEKLEELGPKGYETMNAIYQMTDEQLDELKGLWETGLTLPEGQADIVVSGYQYMGEMATQGFSDALNDHKAAHDAAHGLGQAALDGLQEVIYKEMLKALIAAVTNSDMPAANKVSTSTFAPEEMARLVNIAKSYGNGRAVIFATPEFVDAMGPDAIGMPIYGPFALTAAPVTPGSAPGYATPVYSPRDI